MSIVRHLYQTRSGAAAMEFGLIAGVFVPLCLAALDGELLLWTKGALQSSAATTARCAALNSSNCTDVQQFAVDSATSWVFSGVIDKTNVSVATACVSHISYKFVTITCQFWARTVLPPPLNGLTLTSVAYHPNSSTAC
jgi:Flp pilus assembly protein TadG